MWEERVAQPVEHLTFNQGVMGSNPIALTIHLVRNIFKILINKKIFYLDYPYL